MKKYISLSGILFLFLSSMTYAAMMMNMNEMNTTPGNQHMMNMMESTPPESPMSPATKLRVDHLMTRFFKKLQTLDQDLQDQKIKNVLDKIEQIKETMETRYPEKAELFLHILSYVHDTIQEKHGMNGMEPSAKGAFSNDVHGLPEAKPSEVVMLEDGDTYEMTASIVQQEVGNRVIKRLAYNGMIPGPIITVEKGAKIKVKFTNNIDVETTVHSHGLRLDDSHFDGLPTTMGGQQEPLQPGESFTYELNFDDTGVFRYHPHIREDYTQEMGLYGTYHVTEDEYWNPVDREVFMILDDFSEDDLFSQDHVNKTLMGRFGNIMLINNDEDYLLEAKTGETMRWFITNVANTRTFDMRIEDENGKSVDIKLVGGDIGRIEHETIIQNQIIAPAERYIGEVAFEKPGTYRIMSKDRLVGTVEVTGNELQGTSSELRDNTADYSLIRDTFQTYLDKPADKNLNLTIDMGGMGIMHGNTGGGQMGMGMMMDEEVTHDGIEREDTMAPMNRMSTDKTLQRVLEDTDTGKQNMDIDRIFEKGEFVKVKITNDPNSMHPMQHPIHFHGQRFVVLSRDGLPNNNLQRKDTTLIKNGETIEILIEMSHPGVRMSHCHIAEHLQSGMMMTFEVKE